MPTTGGTKSADQLQLFVRASIPCTLRVLWEISAIYGKAGGTSTVDGKAIDDVAGGECSRANIESPRSHRRAVRCGLHRCAHVEQKRIEG